MNMLVKINTFIDYNNPYTVKKAMGMLAHEFSISNKANKSHAEKVLQIAILVYENSANSGVASYSQLNNVKRVVQRMKSQIGGK